MPTYFHSFVVIVVSKTIWYVPACVQYSKTFDLKLQVCLLFFFCFAVVVVAFWTKYFPLSVWSIYGIMIICLENISNAPKQFRGACRDAFDTRLKMFLFPVCFVSWKGNIAVGNFCVPSITLEFFKGLSLFFRLNNSKTRLWSDQCIRNWHCDHDETQLINRN